MSGCVHFNTGGLFRCAVKSEKPCHNCGQFEIAKVEGLTLNTVLQDGDVINEPSHYTQHLPGEVTKDFIKAVLNSNITKDLNPYQVYCLGAALKYRLRAGQKGEAGEDIKKAQAFEKMGGWQD